MNNVTTIAQPLAYAIEAACKSANQDANIEYSRVLGGRSLVEEDDAFERCQITARWCDQASDMVIDVEDLISEAVR